MNNSVQNPSGTLKFNNDSSPILVNRYKNAIDLKNHTQNLYRVDMSTEFDTQDEVEIQSLTDLINCPFVMKKTDKDFELSHF